MATTVRIGTPRPKGSEVSILAVGRTLPSTGDPGLPDVGLDDSLTYGKKTFT